MRDSVYIYIILLFFYVSSSWAVPPVNVVYRIDNRSMWVILADEGMWPNWESGDMIDDHLAHHFEGTSVEGGTSNFVSTTSSLTEAILHAASLGRPNSEEPFDLEYVTYIYMIRPARNFYNVDSSFRTARNTTRNDIQRNRLTSLINDYPSMEEWVAREGFLYQRIISSARLTGAMLNEYGVHHGSPLFSQLFWESRWVNNVHYNHDYDGDMSNSQVYAEVGIPNGYIEQVENGNQLPVRLGFTCEGVGSVPQRQHLRASTSTCSGERYLNIKRHFYDKELLGKILLLIE